PPFGHFSRWVPYVRFSRHLAGGHREGGGTLKQKASAPRGVLRVYLFVEKFERIAMYPAGTPVAPFRDSSIFSGLKGYSRARVSQDEGGFLHRNDPAEGTGRQLT